MTKAKHKELMKRKKRGFNQLIDESREGSKAGWQMFVRPQHVLFSFSILLILIIVLSKSREWNSPFFCVSRERCRGFFFAYNPSYEQVLKRCISQAWGIARQLIVVWQKKSLIIIKNKLNNYLLVKSSQDWKKIILKTLNTWVFFIISCVL